MKFTQEQISEIISEITTKESGMSGLIQLGLESLMKSERTLHNLQKDDVSNGYRSRRVIHSGKLFELQVPRSRTSNFYPTLLGVLKDQEEEAQRVVFSLYSEGLTTLQVGKIYEQIYGKHYSKAQVSRLMNDAREEVGLWLKRKLERRYPIVYIDATYVLTRRDQSVSNEAYYVILGVKENSTREVLDVVNFPTESASNWSDIFDGLKERGLETIDLFVCDGLSGIENSITSSFNKADIQLCTVHLKRNLINKIKPKDKADMAKELKQLFDPLQEITPEQACHNFKNMIVTWTKSYPILKNYLKDRYALYFTYFKYEKQIRTMIYTTNWIERLNKDFKRVLKMRGAMPNADSVLLLMGNVAKNRDKYDYKIYQFSESRLFNKHI